MDWNGERPLWCNPPFVLLPAVEEHIRHKGAHLLMLCPGWREALPGFWALSTQQYRLPHGPTFRRQPGPPLPARDWPVWVLLIRHDPRVARSLLPPPVPPVSAYSVPGVAAYGPRGPVIVPARVVKPVRPLVNPNRTVTTYFQPRPQLSATDARPDSPLRPRTISGPPDTPSPLNPQNPRSDHYDWPWVHFSQP